MYKQHFNECLCNIVFKHKIFNINILIILNILLPCTFAKLNQLQIKKISKNLKAALDLLILAAYNW